MILVLIVCAIIYIILTVLLIVVGIKYVNEMTAEIDTALADIRQLQNELENTKHSIKTIERESIDKYSCLNARVNQIVLEGMVKSK